MDNPQEAYTACGVGIIANAISSCAKASRTVIAAVVVSKLTK